MTIRMTMATMMATATATVKATATGMAMAVVMAMEMTTATAIAAVMVETMRITAMAAMAATMTTTAAVTATAVGTDNNQLNAVTAMAMAAETGMTTASGSGGVVHEAAEGTPHHHCGNGCTMTMIAVMTTIAAIVTVAVTTVGTLNDGYIQKVPLPRVPVLLPRVPRIQSASHMCHTHDTCYYAQVPRIPTWSDLVRSFAGLGRSTLQPFSLLLV